MALNAYMTIKGQKQGAIKGSVVQKGREDQILVHAVTHEIVSPRDAASGLPTGKRMHKPMVVTKDVDKASPLLFNALAGNENLTEVQLNFWTPQVKSSTGTASEVQYYTIRLTNASIASLSTVMPDNRDADLVKQSEYELLALTYETITWIWNDGGITAQDTWAAATR